MTHHDRAGLSVDVELSAFLEDEVLPGLGLAAEAFWTGVANMFARFAPENRKLLARRDHLQARIDDWYRERRGQPHDPAGTESFLRDIGYLVDEPAPFSVTTERVDDELAKLAGPQLVVPILNARFLLNAANARWGSLYDALYGTDALGDLPPGGPYDAARGARVVARAKAFLDEAVPLETGSYSQVAGWSIEAGTLVPGLRDPAQFVGYRGEPAAPTSILLVNNGLHIELVIDRSSAIGAADAAGLSDVVLESALSTICDLEDSVAAVDAAGQGRGLSQLAGADEGRPVGQFPEGREDAERGRWSRTGPGRRRPEGR